MLFKKHISITSLLIATLSAGFVFAANGSVLEVAKHALLGEFGQHFHDVHDWG